MSIPLDPHPRLRLSPVSALFEAGDELVTVTVPREFVYNSRGQLFRVLEGPQSLPVRLLNDEWFVANRVRAYDDSSGN
jgi:hypothetical protein